MIRSWCGYALSALALAGCVSPGPKPLEKNGVKPNAFVMEYGAVADVKNVTVVYEDGTIPGAFDDQARGYINSKLPPARKAAVEAAAAAKGNAAGNVGERFSEFLVTDDIRSRLGARRNDGRVVNVVVRVTETKLTTVEAMVLVTGITQIFPSLNATFEVSDAESGARLASGTITNVVAIGARETDAKRHTGVEYDFWGLDSNLRLMVNLGDALAENAVHLLRSPNFQTGASQGSRFPVSFPVIDVKLEDQ